MAYKLGLKGTQVRQFTHIVMQMSKMFHDLDLSLVEINPLVVNDQGQLVCLDGKINIDDEIKIDNKSLGKVLINEKYPFAIIKFKDEKFNYSKEYRCNSAKIKFIKTIWI